MEFISSLREFKVEDPGVMYREKDLIPFKLHTKEIKSSVERYRIGRPRNTKFIGFTATPVMNSGQDIFTLVNVMKGSPRYLSGLDYITPSTNPEGFKLRHGEWRNDNDDTQDPFLGRKLTNTKNLGMKLNKLISVYKKDWDTTRFPLVSKSPYFHMFPLSKGLKSELDKKSVSKNSSLSIGADGLRSLTQFRGKIERSVKSPIAHILGNIRPNKDCTWTTKAPNMAITKDRQSGLFITASVENSMGKLVNKKYPVLPQITLHTNKKETIMEDVWSQTDLVHEVLDTNNPLSIQRYALKEISPKIARFVTWMESTENLVLKKKIMSKQKHFAYCSNKKTADALSWFLLRSGWTMFLPPKVRFNRSKSGVVHANIVQIHSLYHLKGIVSIRTVDGTVFENKLDGHQNELKFELTDIETITITIQGKHEELNANVVLLNDDTVIWKRSIMLYESTSIQPKTVESEPEKYLRAMKKHPKRFLLLDGNVKPSVALEFIEMFNSGANKDGNYIQLIILTSEFKEGITLKDVKHIHFIDTPSTMTETIQVLGRASRVCSFEHLPKREWFVQSHVWMHIENDEIRKLKAQKDISEFISTEPRIWNTAEDNYRLVNQIMKMLVGVAVDCSQHKIESGVNTCF